MSRWSWWVALVLAAACIDVQEGDQGLYGSPCTTFGTLLLCDRESGGADPAAGRAPEPVTCASVCQQLQDCGFLDPGEQAECVGDCAGFPQSALECIVAAGCNLDRLQGCFGASGGDQ